MNGRKNAPVFRCVFYFAFLNIKNDVMLAFITSWIDKNIEKRERNRNGFRSLF